MESYLKSSDILYKFIHNIYYRERDNFINNTFVFDFNYIQRNGAWTVYNPGVRIALLTIIIKKDKKWKQKNTL